MRRLEVRLTWGPDREVLVGELAEQDRRVFLEYAPDFLGGGLQISPWKLPLVPGLVEHRDRGFGPLPGVFGDSLPDGWGLLLMDRHLRRTGRDPRTVSPLERLAYLGRTTMGALTYHPPSRGVGIPESIDLHGLAEEVRHILAGPSHEILPVLRRAGGSPGGARPKVLVGVSGREVISGEEEIPSGYEHWMVKFPGTGDPPEIARVELAYARMAREAGLHLPEVRGFPGGEDEVFFGVRRFDRPGGGRRLHAHTLGGLIHSDFRIPGCDYDHLFRVCSGLTREHEDLVRCFRRMVFNLTACNQDDHVKNFAFLMEEDGRWQLSPAYDLTHSPSPSSEHQMTVDGVGHRPEREDCLRLATRHGLRPAQCEAIVEEVHEALRHWGEHAEAEACSPETIEAVQRDLREL